MGRRMVSRYLIEAGVIFIIPYVLVCYLYTKQYPRAAQKATVWILMLALSLPSYAFWAILYVILRIIIDAPPSN